MMLGSTSLALIAVIGIPITMETMASASCRPRPAFSAACARLGLFGLLPELCGAHLREVLNPLRQAGCDIFGVFGP